MNKSVPTLLGIVILLLVVLLVVGIIQYQTTKKIGEGQRVTGTVGGQLVTGVKAPTEFIEETGALAREARPEPEARRIMLSPPPGPMAERRMRTRGGQAERETTRRPVPR